MPGDIAGQHWYDNLVYVQPEVLLMAHVRVAFPKNRPSVAPHRI